MVPTRGRSKTREGPMRRRWLTTSVVAASLVVGLGLGAAAPARAQAPQGDALEAGENMVSAFADFAFYSGTIGEADTFLFSPLVGGSVGVGPVELALSWGAAYASVSGPIEDQSE